MKKITVLFTAALIFSVFGCADYESEVTGLSDIEEAVSFMFTTDSTTVPDTLGVLSLERLSSALDNTHIDTTSAWLDLVIASSDAAYNGLTVQAALNTLSAFGPSGTDAVYTMNMIANRRSSYGLLDLSSISASSAEIAFYFNNYITLSLWKTDGTPVTVEGNGSLSAEMLSYIWTVDYQKSNKIIDGYTDQVKDGARITLDRGQYIVRFNKAEAVLSATAVKLMIVENE